MLVHVWYSMGILPFRFEGMGNAVPISVHIVYHFLLQYVSFFVLLDWLCLYHDHGGVFFSSVDNSVGLDVLSIVIKVFMSLTNTMMSSGFWNSCSTYCYLALKIMPLWTVRNSVKTYSLFAMPLITYSSPHNFIGLILGRHWWLLILLVSLEFWCLWHYHFRHCFLRLVEPFPESFTFKSILNLKTKACYTWDVTLCVCLIINLIVT